VNKLRGRLQVAAVRAPGSGDQRTRMLQDIAFLTGGKFITEDLDPELRNIQISDLHQAKKITIDKNCTVIEGQTKSELPSLDLGPATFGYRFSGSLQLLNENRAGLGSAACTRQAAVAGR
jgi:chaperonin GroEL (HSP60 family)